ncbi:TetR/AcrR family transcriptional regulator [Nocardioides sp. P5_E3]
MPRQRTRTQPQGDASRLALLEATLRLAGERGYVGTTMAKVTRATGLPASSVYWHFANKDELIADAVAHGFETWRSTIDPWTSFDPDVPRAEQLFSQLQSVVLAPDDRLGYWRMGLLLALETGPAVGSAPRDRFLGIRAIATDQLGAWWSLSVGGSDPRARTMARLTLAALDGLFVARLSDPAEDVQDALHLLATGLDAVADQLSDDADVSRTGDTAQRAGVQRPTQDSRLKLLRAAGEVAADSGYDGASIARICAAAGLPASSLYWHFVDKDDLLAEVVDQSYEEWYADQPAWDLPADGTAWDDELRGHLAQSMGSLATRPIFLRLGYHLLLLRRDDPPAARARFVDVRARARGAIADWLTGAIPDAGAMPGPASMLLMALSDGLFFSNQLDTPPSDAALFSDLVTRVLAAGARATVSS